MAYIIKPSKFLKKRIKKSIPKICFSNRINIISNNLLLSLYSARVHHGRNSVQLSERLCERQRWTSKATPSVPSGERHTSRARSLYTRYRQPATRDRGVPPAECAACARRAQPGLGPPACAGRRGRDVCAFHTERGGGGSTTLRAHGPRTILSRREERPAARAAAARQRRFVSW